MRYESAINRKKPRAKSYLEHGPRARCIIYRLSFLFELYRIVLVSSKHCFNFYRLFKV